MPTFGVLFEDVYTSNISYVNNFLLLVVIAVAIVVARVGSSAVSVANTNIIIFT